MSFILDALKKSESERQRQSVPSLLDIPLPASKSRLPIWGILLGLLLGVNLVVLVVVLARHDAARPVASRVTSEPLQERPQPRPSPAAAQPAPSAAQTATAAAQPASAPASTPAAAPAGTPFSPMDAAPVYAPEIPVDQGNASAREATSSADSPRMQVVRPEPAAPAQTTLPSKALIPPDPNEVVPTLQELNLSGNHAIPDLHLDLHVYAARPADRFVFINNRKYKEGSTLQEGPTVERITRDGVLLRYQSLRFLLPRQ